MTSSLPPDPQQLPPATTRSALPAILTRALGLTASFAVAWLLVDRGLGAWVQHQDAIVGQVARYVPEADPEDLQTLLMVGDLEAPMTVVLACDMALPDCRKRLASLAAWQEQPSKFLKQADGTHDGLRRLVFLPRPAGPDGTAVALTLHALEGQGQFWGAVPKLAQDTTTWKAATLDRALHGVDVDPKRLARDRDDAETLLAVQVERTMAEALEIPPDSGVLSAGLPLAATQSDGPALFAALDASEAQLSESLAFFGGDVSLAQARGLASLPRRTRDRFVRWILVGKKVSSLPEAAQDDAQSHEEDGAP